MCSNSASIWGGRLISWDWLDFWGEGPRPSKCPGPRKRLIRPSRRSLGNDRFEKCRFAHFHPACVKEGCMPLPTNPRRYCNLALLVQRFSILARGGGFGEWYLCDAENYVQNIRIRPTRRPFYGHYEVSQQQQQQ